MVPGADGEPLPFKFTDEMKRLRGGTTATENEKLRAKIRVTARKPAIFTATSPRDGKTMNKCAGNRSEGALRPQNHDFSGIFPIFWPYRAKIRRKMRNLNKGFQATAHKLSLCKRLRTLLTYTGTAVGRRLNPDVGPKK